ncbi:hypothetical protein ABGB12_00915 [Actinocorallia sp. B10E7]|uniref:hypothetical protein n=1 Tax=Actinocorallia sp. B10E7 TaxID=3153558 RepID=UPI00325EACDB
MMGFSFGRFAMAAATLGVLTVPVSTATAAERDPLKPVWLNTLKADNGFDIILAPGGKNVWAFGTAHPDYKNRPLIYRKSGSTWKRAELPRGLNGWMKAADASSANNVWTVGSDSFDDRGATYLLHWDGRRWSLVRHWDARIVSAVAATGKHGVWVFDSQRPRALRFDGRRWRKAKTPISIWGAKAHGKTIWAWGFDKNDRARVVRFDGRRWKTVDPGALLPEQTRKSITLFDAPVIDGKDVWMVGYHISDWKDENSKENSFLLRYKNGKWRKEKTDPAVPIGFEPVPDGRGGLWFLASEDTSDPDGVSEEDLFLTHRTASGRWTERFLGHVVRGTPGVADMVRLPGTQRLLGAGHIEPPTGNYDAAIFELP